jgi:hypothetical protein
VRQRRRAADEEQPEQPVLSKGEHFLSRRSWAPSP